jgi:myo-inositol 2-dehydrogenase/D-chiro-inositol 1-dehydrogenase
MGEQMAGTGAVRVGFLGGGFIAHHHGKMLHTSRKQGTDVDLVAVHDPDPDKAAGFAARSGAAVVASEDELLAMVDAVYVTTWTAEHRRLVEKVAARGLPVFCEKPLATNLADVVAMTDAVEAAGVVNQVGLVLRDSPAFLYLRHLVRRPESGRVMSVVFRNDQYIPIQGMYASQWRGDPAKAGAGTLIEHSIHDLDLLDWLFGPTTGVTGRTSGFHAIEGIEDVTVATLAFDGGGLGSLVSVWHDVLSRPSLRRMEVFCEHAYYVLEGDVVGPVGWTRDGPGADGSPGGPVIEGAVDGSTIFDALADAGIAVRNPDAAFIDAVVDGTPAYPAFRDALRAHQLTDAIYRSAASGGSPIDTAP